MTRSLPPADPARPTLLVFTVGARAEGRRRRLLPERFGDRETAVYQACLDEALAAGRALGCRLAVSSPAPLALPADVAARPQAGRGFGERLAAAFDGAFDSIGTAPVVVVGTDVPGLSAAHVGQALELLAAAPDERRVVAGPSPDGGLYLLASARPLGELFPHVRWRRGSTLADLRRTLTAAGIELVLLEPLADLDRPADLAGWLAARARTGADLNALARRLCRLLAALVRPAEAPGFGPPLPVPVRAPRGRAPPRTPRA